MRLIVQTNLVVFKSVPPGHLCPHLPGRLMSPFSLWDRAEEPCKTLTRCRSSSPCASSVRRSGPSERSCPPWGRRLPSLSRELLGLCSLSSPLTPCIPSTWCPRSLVWRTLQKGWWERSSLGAFPAGKRRQTVVLMIFVHVVIWILKVP